MTSININCGLVAAAVLQTIMPSTNLPLKVSPVKGQSTFCKFSDENHLLYKAHMLDPHKNRLVDAMVCCTNSPAYRTEACIPPATERITG